ncbi:MAG: hypothetical protein FWH20_00775 [Oscillospiraceae bacterium]|nr:hypothetical protein [Oscillospiraceae bacterium]
MKKRLISLLTAFAVILSLGGMPAIHAQSGDAYWRDYFPDTFGEADFTYGSEDYITWRWDNIDLVDDIIDFLLSEGYAEHSDRFSDGSNQTEEYTEVTKYPIIPDYDISFSIDYYDGDGNWRMAVCYYDAEYAEWFKYFTDTVGKAPDDFTFNSEGNHRWEWNNVDFRTQLHSFFLSDGLTKLTENTLTYDNVYPQKTIVTKDNDEFRLTYQVGDQDGTTVYTYIYGEGGENYWRYYFSPVADNDPSPFIYTNEDDIRWAWDNANYVAEIAWFLSMQGYYLVGKDFYETGGTDVYTDVFKDGDTFKIYYNNGNGYEDIYIYEYGRAAEWKGYFLSATYSAPDFFVYVDENNICWEWEDKNWVSDLGTFLQLQGYRQIDFGSNPFGSSYEVTQVDKYYDTFRITYHPGNDTREWFTFGWYCQPCLGGDHEDCVIDGCWCGCGGGGGGDDICDACYFGQHAWCSLYEGTSCACGCFICQPCRDEEHEVCEFKLYEARCDCWCNDNPVYFRPPYLRSGMDYYLLDIKQLLDDDDDVFKIYGVGLTLLATDIDSFDGSFKFMGLDDKDDVTFELEIDFDDCDVTALEEGMYQIEYTQDERIFSLEDWCYRRDLIINCDSGSFMVLAVWFLDEDGDFIGSPLFVEDPCGGNGGSTCLCDGIMSSFMETFATLSGDFVDLGYALYTLDFIFGYYLDWAVYMADYLFEEYAEAIVDLFGEDCIFYDPCLDLINCVQCKYLVLYFMYDDIGELSLFDYFVLMEGIAVPLFEAIEGVNAGYACEFCERFPCMCQGLMNALGAIISDVTSEPVPLVSLWGNLGSLTWLLGQWIFIPDYMTYAYGLEIATLIGGCEWDYDDVEQKMVVINNPCDPHTCIACDYYAVVDEISVWEPVPSIGWAWVLEMNADAYAKLQEFVLEPILNAIDNVNANFDDDNFSLDFIRGSFEYFISEEMFMSNFYDINPAEIEAAFTVLHEAVDSEWAVKHSEFYTDYGANNFISLIVAFEDSEEYELSILFEWNDTKDPGELLLMRVNAYVSLEDETGNWIVQPGVNPGLDWSELKAILKSNGGKFYSTFSEPVPTGLADMRGFTVIAITLIAVSAGLFISTRRRRVK